MARLFFATTLFIFTLILFIIGIIYIIKFAEFSFDSMSILRIFAIGLIVSFSGGGAIVFGISTIKQIISIIRSKDEYEDELPKELFTNKLRKFVSRIFNLKRSITFIYVSILFIIIIAGGIIWKIAYSDDRLLNTEKAIQTSSISQEEPQKYIEIPFFETANLYGNAKISSVYNILNGNIYNGLNWTIKRLIIRITIFEHDGTIRWVRDFNAYVDLPSLSAGQFSININDIDNFGSYQWSIIKAWGYKEQTQ
ncbi:TPA: hypothetical protein ENS27_12185 [bacterium]|nr:hypothetical protein [bacterium]